MKLVDPEGAEYDKFGYALAGVGDVDADGLPDIVVSSLGKGGDIVGDSASGYVFLYRGAQSREVSDPHQLEAPGEGVGPAFAYSVAGGKDLSGEGVADLIVGAPGDGDHRGAAFLYRWVVR